ncbi:zinc finger protein 436 [Osmerus mordax]|uniref:zinc finger protein 436 n=1 Tax=Osmerus mordax TaxID=8014 RepID=UPI00350FB3AB
MKNKSVKKKSLPDPTKWTSKDGGMVKTESEQQQCAGEYVTVNKNGICVNIHIKEEQTEWELCDKSAEECESGSNLTKELLSDSAANLFKSETDQVNTSHFNLQLKDERNSNSEFDMVEVKRETELCLKEDSGDKEKQVNAAEDVDVGICGVDTGVSSAQFFTCPECGVSFTKHCFLEKHLKWIHQRKYHAMLKKRHSDHKTCLTPTVSCPLCNLTFHTTQQLTVHSHKAHPSVPTRRRHPCPTCARSFQYLGNLERHCKRWHKMSVTCRKGHLSCADCGKGFETTWGQGPHRCDEPEDGKSEDRPLRLDTGVQCPDCGKCVRSSQGLAVHMRTHTGEKPYVCKECGKRFSDRSGLCKHTLIHTGAKPHECQVCGKTFARKGHLRSHMTTHSGEKAHSCPECGKKFGLKTGLTNHLRTHTDEKPFHCTVCGKDFSLNSNLKLHLKVHRNEKNHQCVECGLKAVNFATLKTHMRSHTGERPYHCTVCGKQFIRREHLKNHQRTHTGEKPHKCTQCDKSFIQSGDLIRHKRIHAGVKPFECPDCHRRYTASGDLVKHRRIHSDSRPYTCQECGKAFRLSGHLKGHMSTHTGEKPYACPRCQRRFARSHHLTGHLTKCT